MKRFATVLFIVVVLVVIVGLFFIRRNIIFQSQQNSDETSYARIIIPNAQKNTSEQANITETETEANTLISLIPLYATETLLATQNIDFNEDGYDDQINAVKSSNSQNISLVIGLFNPATSNYERSEAIETIVSQIKSFSFSCMDLTGVHKNSLLYTGITDNGLSVFQAFQGTVVKQQVTLEKIADIKTYGSVSVQQISRSDAYALAQANGESFPIIENVTDTSSGNDSMDQLQIVYNYDKRIGQYVKQSETRIPGKKIATDVLAKIQDGTVETFANFLDGLWYKTSNNDGIRYAFFNYHDKEIIFLLADTEEVYNWDNSTLRRNGIYLSAVNSLISNLKRRIDITLTGIDEIKIKLDDDVGMTIKTDNLWDGQYKKMSVKNDFSQKNYGAKEISSLEYLQATENWQTANGTIVNFKDSVCTFSYGETQSTSAITQTISGKDEIIQFRKITGSPLLVGDYKLIRGESVTLIPVVITLSGYSPTGQETVMLIRQ